MKIAVECKSSLLQKACEIFLNKHLTTSKNADIIVKDYQDKDSKTFYISQEKDADLKKPFSKSELVLALENRYKTLHKNPNETVKTENTEERANFEILQKRIELITKEYQEKIIDAIKAFYEK